MHKIQLWSLLHKEDERLGIKRGCQLLEMVTMEVFTMSGCRFFRIVLEPDKRSYHLFYITWLV
jgi:hypothetical protein